MTILTFTLLIFGTSVTAGLLGALTGLGGGVVVVPLLTLFFKVDIRYAIGASLVSVIATSSGAAAAYVQRGLLQHPHRHVSRDRNHPRRVARRLSRGIGPRPRPLRIIFGVVLILSRPIREPRRPDEDVTTRHPLATPIACGSTATFPTRRACRSYNVQRVPAGFSIMFVAGGLCPACSASAPAR